MMLPTRTGFLNSLALACDVIFPSVFTPIPFLLSTIVVVLAAWLGGLWPGLLATVLGAATGGSVLVNGSVALTWHGGMQTAAFLALGTLIVVLSEARLRAARRAMQAQGQLITVFHGLADGVLVADRERGLIFANDAAARLTGFASGEELRQATLGSLAKRFDFLDAAGHPVPADALPDQRALRGEIPPEIVLDVRERATGQGRWWAVKAAPLLHTRPPAAVTIFRDITQQQQAEAAVAASERRFRALIERSADAFALLDARNSFLFTSPAVSRTLGYREDELRGMPVFSLIHAEDDATATTVFAALRTPGAMPTGIFRVRHRDKRWRWIEVTGSSLLDDPAVRAVLVNLRDVTERKTAEDALAASERRFRVLLENSEDAITVVDANGNVLYTSPSTTRILGYTPEEFVATNGLAHLHPDDLPEARTFLASLTASPGG